MAGPFEIKTGPLAQALVYSDLNSFFWGFVSRNARYRLAGFAVPIVGKAQAGSCGGHTMKSRSKTFKAAIMAGMASPVALFATSTPYRPMIQDQSPVQPLVQTALMLKLISGEIRDERRGGVAGAAK